MAACWACCPCCEKCWLCCCLPCCLFCCPCCCKKKKHAYDKEAYVTAPLTIISEKKEVNGHLMSAPPDLWLTSKKEEQLEMMPLTAHVDGADNTLDSGSGFTAGTLSRRSSKSSSAHVRVPIPGDTTFISYKTSLQDYCQKVGWLAPVYTTQQMSGGYQSKVTFGGHTYDTGLSFASTKQDAEQKAAFLGLIGVNTLDNGTKYAGDSCISVPSPGDASFISYKCSLHDFCQQCNILPPRFSTSRHDSGYTSSVTVGSHTFNMPGRIGNSQEAEQKAAYIALLGLCMTDSKAVYHPEACFTVPGPADQNFISFKSSLHDFCQRYKLPPPQYITNQGSNGYSAKLKFGGLFFQSSDYFTSRLEAEQHAAFEALQGLGLLESSVDFVAVAENQQVNGGHGGSFVAVGSIGGTLPSNYSRHSSRPASRPASKPGSRQPSRPSSRPGSRQGSQTHLNDVDTNYLASTATYDVPRRDPAYTMGQRSYSSGGGFAGQPQPRSATMDANATHYATVGRSGNTTPRSNAYPGYNEGDTYNHVNSNTMNSTSSANNRYNSTNTAAYNTTNTAAYNTNNTAAYNANNSSLYNANNTAAFNGNNSASYNTDTSAAYNMAPLIQPSATGGLYSTPSTPGGTLPRNGTLPRGRTQSYDTSQDYKSDNNASTFSYSMTYEQHTTTTGKGGASTLPRKQMAIPGATVYNDLANQMSPTRRAYGSAQNITRDTTDARSPMRSSTSHPALTDLEMEMAGLEGLIKDLNGITTRVV